MDFTPQQKEDLEKKIVEIINSAVEQKKVKEEELSTISTYILNNIDNISDRSSLLHFLEQLSAHWDIFNDLYTLEQGGQNTEEDKKVVANVEELIHTGNLDEALKVAKGATE